MRIKKILSVFLAAVMLFSVMSLGLTGAAAEIDYDTQYRQLAIALQNEHVRKLENYTLTNVTLDNGTEGFDQEARGFAYDHRVVAEDNSAGSILNAANRFYYIAESLMSFKYGVGCYDGNTLLAHVTEKIKPYFASTSGEIIYEDFYGNRYYPSDEEIAAYNKAVSDITAVGAEVGQATLTEYGIYFMEMDDWAYYNVETVLKYFLGNVTAINTGNWYHRFAFVVETSVNTILENSAGINMPTRLTLRTGVYEIDYQREYNESKSKAYFCFAEPTLDRVYEDFAGEFGWTDSGCANLMTGTNPIAQYGQSAAFMVKVETDTETMAYLNTCKDKFDSYITKAYNPDTHEKWDSQFASWSDATVNNHEDTPVILGYAADLANNYSNKALQAFFGDNLGNMVTLAYLFKTSRSDPTRTVRGTAQYVATAEKLDDIIHDIDALISPNENETEDVKIANRVASILPMFLDIGGLLGVEEEIDYSSLEDLIGKVLEKLVFTDSIINMLVELLYPMIVDLIVDNLGSIDVIGGVAVNLVGDILEDNNLAIYPNTLGDLLINDYGDKYRTAATILRNGGDSWENVNCAALVWGVDAAPTDQKKDVFINALCAALGGFTRLLVTFLCGDAEYEWKNPDERFGKNYDLKVTWILDNVWLASQGLYTKLFIPLYRVLGLEEHEFLSSAQYHAAMENNFKDCLKLAVTPIIDWVFNHVAKKPIETIMKLVPNLVHFLSREGGPLEHENDWKGTGHLTESNQWEAHAGYAELQTHSLYSILHHVHLKIVYFGQAININGSIGELIGDGTLGMLTSLNALLNEIISFEYDTDEIYSVNIACYYNDAGEVVLPDSTEYALDPARYPKAETFYYSDSTNTKLSLTQDDDHPFYHDNITYVAKPYFLPAVPEAKLISCGTIDPVTNTVDVDNPGLVFKFLLRYLLSALGYRYDLNVEGLPTLIECFGLDMSGELFMGLTLGDILTNVMLHPDEAICALLELFYSNEEGSLYTVDENGKVVPGKNYTYPVEPIDYHETTLTNKLINPTMTYGAQIKYTEYWTKEYANDFVASLGPLAEDILVMLGLEGMEDGLGGFLENLLNENVFNNDLINTLFNAVYQLIAGLNDSLGVDIEGILDKALDVSFKPAVIYKALDKMLGFETAASREMKSLTNWMDMFYAGVETDPVTGEETVIMQDVELDWGLAVNENTGLAACEEMGISRADAFLRTVASLFSPAAFVIEFLFMDSPLSILGLINLPSYAGYNYAFIGLLEALSCPGILTYEQYYTASLDPDCGDANVIYNLVAPILGLLEKVYENPVETILNLIPNLLFFISIGGLNDFINNLIHFAYVLLDILKPIINGYDLLGGLLSNIDISGFSLNLALPLDIDVNSLISDLLGTLVGDALTIEGVTIKLPYIDLYTLCAGTLVPYTSKENRTIVRLSPEGGGEFLTALLRIVFEVLFMEENHQAVAELLSNLAGEGKLDEYDEETLYLVVNGLFGLIEDYNVLDMVLFAVYMLISNLVPIADTLAVRFESSGLTITELIDSASDMDLFMANLSLVLQDPEKPDVPGTTTDIQAMGSLLDRLIAFFEKIKLFFQQLFNFG